MALFKNDSGQETEGKDLKVKDLSPKNKKRRKEPPQPWGKKERFLVLIILLGTVIVSTVLAISARDWKLPNLPRLTLPEVSSLFSDTFVFETNTSPKQIQESQGQAAIAAFKDKTRGLSGVYGFSVLRLSENTGYGLYDDEIFQAASLIKLPVMLALFEQKPEGYKDLIRAMGKRSDNVAFTKARSLLGDRKIVATISSLGMRNTSLAENQTTPADIALFFQKLYHNELLPESETKFFLDSLTDTIYEEHLAAGVPEDIRVAHKYGREVHVVADGGVVYVESPFVVVIMSKGVVESEADAVFPVLSKLIYDFETSI